MAAWQFSIVLIPKTWAVKNGFDPFPFYGEYGYDTEIAWNENQPQADFIDVLSTLLPSAKSWHKDLLCWGNVKGHDIQVWYEHKKVDDIKIRIDVNQEPSKFIVKLVKIANELECVLFYPELKSISEANEFAVKVALQRSVAAQYVNDPKGFLEGLKN